MKSIIRNSKNLKLFSRMKIPTSNFCSSTNSSFPNVKMSSLMDKLISTDPLPFVNQIPITNQIPSSTFKPKASVI